MSKRQCPQSQIRGSMRYGAQHVLDGVDALRDQLLRHATVVLILLFHFSALHSLLVLLEVERTVKDVRSTYNIKGPCSSYCSWSPRDGLKVSGRVAGIDAIYNDSRYKSVLLDYHVISSGTTVNAVVLNYRKLYVKGIYQTNNNFTDKSYLLLLSHDHLINWLSEQHDGYTQEPKR